MNKTLEIKRVLKELIRQTDGMNQKTVAAEVGISTSYLSQVLISDREGGFDLLSRIAMAVGYSLGELELMASGAKADPAAFRVQANAILDRCMDQRRIINILRKVLAAETAGVLSDVELLLDYTLAKPHPAGQVTPAAKRAS